MVRVHESDRGRNMLKLEAYVGQLHILRAEQEKMGDCPRGTVVTKVTRRVYMSKRKGRREYANFYDNVDVDGKQLHVSKKSAQSSEAELRAKYGEGYDPYDYRIKENLPRIRDKLKYKKYIEESIAEVSKEIKATKDTLNFGKRRKEKEITEEGLEKLGKWRAARETASEERRMERMRKTMIARYGTKEQIEKEFENEGELTFYLCDGKIMETRRGESVRSRAELVVADVLSDLKIPYMYEVYMQEIGVSCDFVVAVGGKTYYMELLGLMDQWEYRERWREKLVKYGENGIRIGKNLIVIDLTDRKYLDTGWLREVLYGLAVGKMPSGVIYGVENMRKAEKLGKRVKGYKNW